MGFGLKGRRGAGSSSRNGTTKRTVEPQVAATRHPIRQEKHHQSQQQSHQQRSLMFPWRKVSRSFSSSPSSPLLPSSQKVDIIPLTPTNSSPDKQGQQQLVWVEERSHEQRASIDLSEKHDVSVSAAALSDYNTHVKDEPLPSPNKHHPMLDIATLTVSPVKSQQKQIIPQQQEFFHSSTSKQCIRIAELPVVTKVDDLAPPLDDDASIEEFGCCTALRLMKPTESLFRSVFLMNHSSTDLLPQQHCATNENQQIQISTPQSRGAERLLYQDLPSLKTAALEDSSLLQPQMTNHDCLKRQQGVGGATIPTSGQQDSRAWKEMTGSFRTMLVFQDGRDEKKESEGDDNAAIAVVSPCTPSAGTRIPAEHSTRQNTFVSKQQNYLGSHGIGTDTNNGPPSTNYSCTTDFIKSRLSCTPKPDENNDEPGDIPLQSLAAKKSLQGIRQQKSLNNTLSTREDSAPQQAGNNKSDGNNENYALVTIVGMTEPLPATAASTGKTHRVTPSKETEHPDDEVPATLCRFHPQTSPPRTPPRLSCRSPNNTKSPSGSQVRFQQERRVRNVATAPADDVEVDDSDYYDDDDDEYYSRCDESLITGGGTMTTVSSNDDSQTQYTEFRLRRGEGCSGTDTASVGCSEHYAEFQKRRRKRRRDRGQETEEFSLTDELQDLFSDCTYIFRFFGEQGQEYLNGSNQDNAAAAAAAATTSNAKTTKAKNAVTV